jgi:tetratricopeptide (TPR) repeat protein
MRQERKPRGIGATEEGIERLEKAKAAKGWTYLKIAEAAEVSEKSVKNVFGRRCVDKDTASKVAKALELSIEDIVALEEKTKARTNTSKLYENLGRRGVIREQFIGRETELETLHELLQQNSQVAIAAIAGMGGVGKTELALQYARSHLQTYQGGVCWLTASGVEVGIQIERFAFTQFNLTPPQDWDLPERVDFCWRQWHPGEVLVVFDDVTDYKKQVKPYLPPASSRFKVLVTTRHHLGFSVAHLRLDVLSPEASLDLLAYLIGTERIERELEVAQKLCEWLGYLPLGLELVGRYLVQRQDLSLAKMLSQLRDKKRLRHPALIEADPTMTAELGVAAAFDLSWELLDEEAQKLGCWLSLYAPAPLSLSFQLLDSLPSEQVLAALEDEKIIEQVLAALEDEKIIEDVEESLEKAKSDLMHLHLLQRTTEGTYRLHQLIRQFFREKLEESADADDLKRVVAAGMAALAKQIPESPTLDQIKALTPAIPHLEEVAISLKDFLSDEDLIWVFKGLGTFYQAQGFYTLAAPWYEQCLSAVRNHLGEEHLDVATNLTDLGQLYTDLNRYSDAEPLLVQALELRRRLLGQEHRDVTISLNNLAVLYQYQGHYSEAEPLLEQALELQKRLLGEENLDVAKSMNNLATLYQNQERYKDAELLHLQALELQKRLLGEENLDVALSLGNLAALYQKQEYYKEAKPLLEQVLELQKRLLGEEHPRMATSLNNLGELYRSQKRYSEAERFLVQALKLQKRFLGEENLSVANSLLKLADISVSQGHWRKAQSFYEQALELNKCLRREDHPDVANILYNLGAIYLAQKHDSKAEPLLKQALELNKRFLTEEHPDVAQSLNGLAVLYQHQGRYSDAESLHMQALELRKRLLREEHPDVASSLSNLADLYRELRRYEEAEPLCVEALKIKERCLGVNHFRTVLTRKILENIRAEMKKQQSKKYRKFLSEFKRLDDENPEN